MDQDILNNPLINEYFDSAHLDGRHSAIGFAGDMINEYFPRQNIYHSGKHHIWPMLEEAMMAPLQNDADVENQFVAYFFALFHDADQSSINHSRELLNHKVNLNAGPKWRRLFEMVHEAIQATDYNFENIELLPEHVQHCIKLDVKSLMEPDHNAIIKQEMLIFREFQSVRHSQFVETRINVLERIYKICKLDWSLCQFRMNHLLHWQPKIAVFPGSFNPFHIGHYNVLQQAEQIFDKVVIAVGFNCNKDKHDPTSLRGTLKYHQVDVYTGLLTDYLQENYHAGEVTIIRGMRNGQDLQYEQNLRAAVKDLYPHAQFAYFVCDADVAHVSSSLCRDISNRSHTVGYTALGNYNVIY